MTSFYKYHKRFAKIFQKSCENKKTCTYMCLCRISTFKKSVPESTDKNVPESTFYILVLVSHCMNLHLSLQINAPESAFVVCLCHTTQKRWYACDIPKILFHMDLDVTKTDLPLLMFKNHIHWGKFGFWKTICLNFLFKK